MAISPRKSAVALLGVVVLSGGVVFAQPQGAASQEPAYDAPVVRFAGAISLLEAVRATLENSPDIKLQEASYLFQTGVVQERRTQPLEVVVPHRIDLRQCGDNHLPCDQAGREAYPDAPVVPEWFDDRLDGSTDSPSTRWKKPPA